ncbi:MAG: ABC transporter ATP-binding protein [Bacteroidales bacterium]|jgi:iron complex transport system ATP-binding protein|nr:ABC transporter ATP-binding protein [Bacteroidales bacterium]MDD3724478.1 ABC transporter ATP-binding protein [Bacteroidales bacterium]MDY0053101.1 ABC transporter ATP-binding protein [Bacteroidales bacterium]
MIIEVKNLSYKAGEKTILSDINFSLKAGGFYIVLGRNGSGKTTLLKSLSKSIIIEDKKVFINNEDINNYSPKRLAKQLSIVPQHTEFLFDFSAFQIVMMGRMPYQKLLQTDSSKDFEIVKESMQSTNTWHLRNQSIKQLSGGELQRVIIARALTQKTPIILLDEPISNLDIKHQFEIMELLKKINNERQTTIFLILHDLNLAYKYGDEILIMESGKLKLFGDKQDILNTQNIEDIFKVNANIVDNSYINITKI